MVHTKFRSDERGLSDYWDTLPWAWLCTPLGFLLVSSHLLSDNFLFATILRLRNEGSFTSLVCAKHHMYIGKKFGI